MTVLETMVIEIKGNLVRDNSLLMRVIYGRETELVQDHLGGLQEARDSLMIRDLIEEDCRIYYVIIVRSLIILSLIFGQENFLKKVQIQTLRMK